MMSKEASTKIVKYKPPISRVLLGNIRMGIWWSKENTNCFIYRLSLILDAKQTNQAYTSSCSQDEQGSLYNTVIGTFTAPWSGVLVLGQDSNWSKRGSRDLNLIRFSLFLKQIWCYIVNIINMLRSIPFSKSLS